MATVPSLTVNKSIPFKGGVRITGNRYHFTGGTPSSDSNWHALMDAVVALEKVALLTDVEIVECIGYAAGSDVPVSTKDYAVAGTYALTDWVAPGECTALVRYATAARSTKNHPIYCFNYYHHVSVSNAAATCDYLDGGQRTAFETYSGDWVSGITAGGITAVRATPQGHSATGAVTEQMVTHRDFPFTSSNP